MQLFQDFDSINKPLPQPPRSAPPSHSDQPQHICFHCRRPLANIESEVRRCTQCGQKWPLTVHAADLYYLPTWQLLLYSVLSMGLYGYFWLWRAVRYSLEAEHEQPDAWHIFRPTAGFFSGILVALLGDLFVFHDSPLWWVALCLVTGLAYTVFRRVAALEYHIGGDTALYAAAVALVSVGLGMFLGNFWILQAIVYMLGPALAYYPVQKRWNAVIVRENLGQHPSRRAISLIPAGAVAVGTVLTIVYCGAMGYLTTPSPVAAGSIIFGSSLKPLFLKLDGIGTRFSAQSTVYALAHLSGSVGSDGLTLEIYAQHGKAKGWGQPIVSSAEVTAGSLNEGFVQNSTNGSYVNVVLFQNNGDGLNPVYPNIAMGDRLKVELDSAGKPLAAGTFTLH